MKLERNYLKWVSDGVLILRELSQKDSDDIKIFSPLARRYYQCNEYLLNATHTISHGVLEIEGMLHEDKLICDNSDISIKNVVFNRDSNTLEEYRNECWIGQTMVGPYKTKKFKLLKFKRVIEFDRSRMYIKLNRYVKKSGYSFKYVTSNFRIVKYGEEDKL